MEINTLHHLLFVFCIVVVYIRVVLYIFSIIPETMSTWRQCHKKWHTTLTFATLIVCYEKTVAVNRHVNIACWQQRGEGVQLRTASRHLLVRQCGWSYGEGQGARGHQQRGRRVGYGGSIARASRSRPAPPSATPAFYRKTEAVDIMAICKLLIVRRYKLMFKRKMPRSTASWMFYANLPC